MTVYLPSIRQLPPPVHAVLAAAVWFGKNGSERFNKATMKSVSRANTWHGPLRRRRYEQPPASYYENFLSEFRRRQRDELLRQPVWRICFERAHGFALRHNVRPYPAGVAVVVACAAVVSIKIYQQPEHVQIAVESSPVPSTPPANAEREFNLAPPAMPRTFNAELNFLPGSRDIPLLPADLLRSDQFVPLNLERESLDDHSMLER